MRPFFDRRISIGAGPPAPDAGGVAGAPVAYVQDAGRAADLLKAADGYDPAAADAQAEALCAKADRKVIAPLLRLMAAYRLAVAMAPAPVAIAAGACGLSADPELEQVALTAALAATVAPLGAYLSARLNFLAMSHAHYERALLFDLDLGAERRTAAAEFMTLDPTACRHGLQDFAGRTRALIALTRRLDKSSALLAKDVRYLYRAAIVLVGTLALAGVGALVWRAFEGADASRLAMDAGVLGLACLAASLILWRARGRIDALLVLLAPPSESADAFVVICARMLGLLGDVIAQNNVLRRA